MKQFHFREVGGGRETIFSFGVALWFNKLMDIQPNRIRNYLCSINNISELKYTFQHNLEYLQVDNLIQKLPVGTSQGFKLKTLAFTLKCRQSSLRY